MIPDSRCLPPVLPPGKPSTCPRTSRRDNTWRPLSSTPRTCNTCLAKPGPTRGTFLSAAPFPSTVDHTFSLAPDAAREGGVHHIGLAARAMSNRSGFQRAFCRAARFECIVHRPPTSRSRSIVRGCVRCHGHCRTWMSRTSVDGSRNRCPRNRVADRHGATERRPDRRGRGRTQGSTGCLPVARATRDGKNGAGSAANRVSVTAHRRRLAWRRGAGHARRVPRHRARGGCSHRAAAVRRR